MSSQDVGQVSYVYDLFRKMDGFSINQVYYGDFSTTVTDNILSAVEEGLSNLNEDVKLRKRIYFLTVESLQNITRHEEKANPWYKKNCFFLLQGSGTLFYITSGNYIANERIEKLRSRIEQVNSLDTDSLRAYAKELMEAGNYSGRGGAGLGIIEMARKSEHKLQYAFVPFNEKISYFYFQIKIDLSAGALPDITAADVKSFTNTQYIHQLAYNYKLNFIYSGSFFTTPSASFNAMLKHSLGALTTATASLPVQEIVQVLANNMFNSQKHASEIQEKGIFIVYEEQDHLVLIAGKQVAKNATDGKHVNNTSDELKQLTAIESAGAANGVSIQVRQELTGIDHNYDFCITQVKIV